ncbi:XRE family transcriptional regulator [Paracoccus sp. p3-h83]|uniref:XRE family transcriptional regulator n=1 Tax=Paracoccus sp. p3-h83 TaxID=3342805 RepID=UPI0035B7AA5B
MRFLGRPPVAPRTALAARLKQVREAICGDDRDHFATLTGIAPNTIGNYERGDRVPDADMIKRYRAASGASADWLVSGEGEMFRGGAGNISLEEAGMVWLPVYDGVRASAGPGAVPISEQAESIVSFQRRFLKDQGAAPESCSVIWARGDSMMPTIPDGSILVVDSSQREVSNGCIMVIGVGDDLLVKRVRRRLDGLIDLISDNTAYAPETLGPDALAQLRVIGRVVYFCRTP